MTLGISSDDTVIFNFLRASLVGWAVFLATVATIAFAKLSHVPAAAAGTAMVLVYLFGVYLDDG